jgi:hypothetical protein
MSPLDCVIDNLFVIFVPREMCNLMEGLAHFSCCLPLKSRVYCMVQLTKIWIPMTEGTYNAPRSRLSTNRVHVVMMLHAVSKLIVTQSR